MFIMAFKPEFFSFATAASQTCTLVGHAMLVVGNVMRDRLIEGGNITDCELLFFRLSIVEKPGLFSCQIFLFTI